MPGFYFDLWQFARKVSLHIRRIATVWVIISLTVAVFIGIVGRALYPADLQTTSEAENIFIIISTNLLRSLAGLVMAGILAATISSSDSYLLIATSALVKNIYQGIYKKMQKRKK